MIRFFDPLPSSFVCPDRYLGRASTLFGDEGMYLFGGDKSVIEGTFAVNGGWHNPDRSMRGGKCRIVLTLT